MAANITVFWGNFTENYMIFKTFANFFLKKVKVEVFSLQSTLCGLAFCCIYSCEPVGVSRLASHICRLKFLPIFQVKVSQVRLESFCEWQFSDLATDFQLDSGLGLDWAVLTHAYVLF